MRHERDGLTYVRVPHLKQHHALLEQLLVGLANLLNERQYFFSRRTSFVHPLGCTHLVLHESRMYFDRLGGSGEHLHMHSEVAVVGVIDGRLEALAQVVNLFHVPLELASVLANGLAAATFRVVWLVIAAL